MKSTELQKTPIIARSMFKSFYFIVSFVCLLILILGITSVYHWQHSKVTYLQDQVADLQSDSVKSAAISLSNLKARLALPNVVIDDANSPADLIAFLGANNTRCYMGAGSGYFKVIATTSDTFAKMQYGCTLKNSTDVIGRFPAYILAKKVNTSWSLINPTNQWLSFNNQVIPSCTMVNANKISKLVTPQCWSGPALSSNTSVTDTSTRSVIPVTNP